MVPVPAISEATPDSFDAIGFGDVNDQVDDLGLIVSDEHTGNDVPLLVS